MWLWKHVVTKGWRILFPYGSHVFLKCEFESLELGWWEEKNVKPVNLLIKDLFVIIKSQGKIITFLL
jgi:hypothetical protein